PISGPAAQIFSPGFAQQFSEANNAGFVVTGYDVLDYDIANFKSANMFGDQQQTAPSTPQPAPVPAPAPNSTNSTPSPNPATAPTATQPTPQFVPDGLLEAQLGLENHFAQYLRIYSFAKDASSLVNGLIPGIEVSNVISLILQEMAAIQSALHSCNVTP